METYDKSIVIQNGSSLIRCGISGNDRPYAFPSVIGTPKYPEMFGIMFGTQINTFVGEEAILKRGVLRLVFPVQNGVVTDYDAAKLLWEKCDKNEHVDVDHTRHKTLLTESICDDKRAREKKTQIFFQEFEVPGFFIQNRTKLALYGVGKATGLSVHSGNEVTQYVACLDGTIIDNGILDTYVAGKNVTMHLKETLSNEMKLDFSSSAEIQIVKNIKEKVCYVSLDPEAEHKNFSNGEGLNSIEFKLPDESVINISSQALMSPQVMFDPKKIGQDAFGMHENIIDVTKRAEQVEIQKLMLGNIVLSGGNTLLRNLVERVESGVKQLSGLPDKVKVIAPVERQNWSWIGGSILSCLSSFEQQWITKAEYEEFGPQIIHKKCPF